MSGHQFNTTRPHPDSEFEPPRVVDFRHETPIDLDQDVGDTDLADAPVSVAVHVTEHRPDDVAKFAGGDPLAVLPIQQRSTAPSEVLLKTNVDLVSVERLLHRPRLRQMSP